MNKTLVNAALDELTTVMMDHYRVASKLDMLIQETKFNLDSKDNDFLEQMVKARYGYMADFRNHIGANELTKRSNKAVENLINAIKAEEGP